MPTPGEGTVFKYRAYFDDDPDQPFEDGPDFFWQVNVGAGDEYTARYGASRPVVDESRHRISFLVDLGEFGGISGAVAADAFQEDNGSRVHRNGWTSSTTFEFPEAKPADLSRSDSRSSRWQNEVFHHQGPPDLEEILACPNHRCSRRRVRSVCLPQRVPGGSPEPRHARERATSRREGHRRGASEPYRRLRFRSPQAPLATACLDAFQECAGQVGPGRHGRS